jgi:AAA15 family ATPase/GTPase
VYERLDIYESRKPTLVFERKGNEYSFNAYKELEALVVRNIRNKLFVCTAASWNFEIAKPVVEFIVNDLYTCFAYSYNLPQILEGFKRSGIYDEYKRFCLALLNAGDLSISNFEMGEEEIPDQMKMLLLEILNRNSTGIPTNKVNTYKFTMTHRVEIDGEEKEIPLDLRMESLGTISLFYFAPLLFDSLKNGKTLFVDEIDKSLHPILVQYIVSLFLNKEINKHNAQLICNTHDTNLLSLDIFRRDEVWFMERNPKNGASELYPLTDFSPRKDENIEKGYMLGRYGAIPFIKANTDLWE